MAVRRSLIFMAILTASCGGSKSIDNSSEWVQVLGQKKAAQSAKATPQQKQVYADTLAAFVTRHPTHGRAREVYHRVQLDFATELSALGRDQDAIRFYRAVLHEDRVFDGKATPCQGREKYPSACSIWVSIGLAQVTL